MRKPMELSLKFLRKRGYYPEVIETKIPFPKPYGTTRDPFGCDILAVASAAPPLLAQTTSRQGMSARKKRLEEIDALKLWCNWGRVELHGWYKDGGLWRAKVFEYAQVDGAPHAWIGVLGVENLTGGPK